MTENMSISFTGLFTIIGGIIFFFIGAWLTYSTINTNINDINPRFLIPIGIIISLVGILLIISKE
jgi:hypothetical protein